MFFSSYQTDGFFDAMFEADRSVRPHAQLVLATRSIVANCCVTSTRPNAQSAFSPST
jgi:hypothetical protein